MRCELQLTWVGAQKEDGAPQGWDRWEEFSWSFNQVPEAECGLMQECKPHGSHGHRGHAPAQASSPYTFTGFSWGRLRGGEGARQNPPVGWAGEGQPHLQLCPHYRQELQFSAGGGEAEQTLPLPLGDKKPQGRREGKGRLSTPGWGAGSHPGSEPLETVYFPERRDYWESSPPKTWRCSAHSRLSLHQDNREGPWFPTRASRHHATSMAVCHGEAQVCERDPRRGMSEHERRD